MRAYAWRQASDTLADIRLFVLYHDPEHTYAVPHSLGLQKGLLGVVYAYADGLRAVMAAHGIRVHAAEIALSATYMCVPLKGCIDFLGADGYIYDLKTTREEATQYGFGRELQRNPDFRLQAAWYMHLWKLNFGESPKGFRIIAVEKEAPYEGAVFELDQELIADGGIKMLEAITTFQKCTEFDSWPTYPAEIIKVEPWKKPGEATPLSFS